MKLYSFISVAGDREFFARKGVAKAMARNWSVRSEAVVQFQEHEIEKASAAEMAARAANFTFETRTLAAFRNGKEIKGWGE